MLYHEIEKVKVGTSIQGQNPCEKLMLLEPEDTAQVHRAVGSCIQWRIKNNIYW